MNETETTKKITTAEIKKDIQETQSEIQELDWIVVGLTNRAKIDCLEEIDSIALKAYRSAIADYERFIAGLQAILRAREAK